MKFLFWLAFKTLKNTRQSLGTMTWFSLIGVILGVGSLVVSMAVMSGFEETLKRAIIDVVGDAQVVNQKALNLSWQDFAAQIQEIDPTVTAASPFVMVEAIAAHEGQLSGAMIQGLDPDTFQKVTHLKPRVLHGKLSLKSEDPKKGTVLIGKVLAQKLNLKVGDSMSVVLPISNDYDPTQFRRRVGNFKVGAILDMGKYEYDERYIMADIKIAQELAEIGNKYNGLMIKLKDDRTAPDFAIRVSEKLGPGFWARSWRDFNASIFEAVKIERTAIFFVVLIIVIVAAFNVSSSLYINVVQRYSQISLLKTIGLSSKQIRWLFSLQGLMIGGIGVIIGYVFGLLFCLAFVFMQNKWGLLPGSVYKLDHIAIQLNFLDSVAIVFVTLIITFLSALAPANRGAKLEPVQGLRYE